MYPPAPTPAARASAIFGLGIAAIVCTGFGFFWLGWGISAWRPTDTLLWILMYGVTIALVVVSVRTLRRGKAEMKALNVPREEFWQKHGRRFKQINLFEGLGCGIVVALALGFHRKDMLAPGISLVVGLHFAPMARLLHFNAYYFTSAAIVLCDVLAVAFFQGDALTAASALATGMVLWITGFYVLALTRQFRERR